MLDPADRLALIEIVESARLIRDYVAGLDLDRFRADRKTCDAVTMQVFVMAEAANRLSASARALLEPMDWRQVRGVRNRIAHGYGTIDFSIIWTIASADVPGLAARVRAALGNDPDLPS